MDILKWSCSCGKHDFVFGEKPKQKVEVKCPECGQLLTYDPDKAGETEEDDINVGKTEQEQ